VPARRNYLVLRGGADGPVVAEVGLAERARRLSLRAGRYFVVVGGRSQLLEGEVDVRAGQVALVDEAALSRVEYAHLVRRGGGARTSAHALSLGYWLRSSVIQGASPCHGLVVGYALDLEQISLSARVSACRGTHANEVVTAHDDELRLDVRGLRAVDIGIVTVEIGVAAGLSVLHQTFETLGTAPSRTAFAPSVGVSLGATIEVFAGVFAFLEASGRTYFLVVATDSSEVLRARFAVDGTVGFGKRW